MADAKDRMTIFPEQKLGEKSKGQPDGKPLRTSVNKPGVDESPKERPPGQAKAKAVRDDVGRQTLGGKLGQDRPRPRH